MICLKCGKTFRGNWNLKRHENICQALIPAEQIKLDTVQNQTLSNAEEVVITLDSEQQILSSSFQLNDELVQKYSTDTTSGTTSTSSQVPYSEIVSICVEPYPHSLYAEQSHHFDSQSSQLANVMQPSPLQSLQSDDVESFMSVSVYTLPDDNETEDYTWDGNIALNAVDQTKSEDIHGDWDNGQYTSSISDTKTFSNQGAFDTSSKEKENRLPGARPGTDSKWNENSDVGNSVTNNNPNNNAAYRKCFFTKHGC